MEREKREEGLPGGKKGTSHHFHPASRKEKSKKKALLRRPIRGSISSLNACAEETEPCTIKVYSARGEGGKDFANKKKAGPSEKGPLLRAEVKGGKKVFPKPSPLFTLSSGKIERNVPVPRKTLPPGGQGDARKGEGGKNWERVTLLAPFRNRIRFLIGKKRESGPDASRGEKKKGHVRSD